MARACPRTFEPWSTAPGGPTCQSRSWRASSSSNEGQIDRAFKLIEATGKRRVGLLGLAFKPGTDDLRESPLVALAERLVGRGFELLIHDPQVAVSRLLGANRAYVDQRIPHLSRFIADSPDEVVNHAEVCVVGAADPDGNRRPQACRWPHHRRPGAFPWLGGLRGRPAVHRHQLVAAAVRAWHTSGRR